ncbi:MAG: DUF5985 family protein [Rhodospirillaceae bacterium]
MQSAIYGAFAASHLIAAAFFLRFWSRTKAPMLMFCSIAFLLLGVSYGLLCFTNLSLIEPSGVYLVRLISFMVIITGIAWTNIHRSSN